MRRWLAAPLVLFLLGLHASRPGQGPLAAAPSAAPDQVKLAVAGRLPSGDAVGLVVSWRSARQPKDCTVQVDGGVERTGTALQYNTYDTNGGWHCHVEVPLAPGPHKYRCGSTGDSAWSTWRVGRMPPGAGGSVAISMAGDMGYLSHAHRGSRTVYKPFAHTLYANWTAMATRARMDTLLPKVDMVYFAGDISYADDAFLAEHVDDYEGVLDGFGRWFENMSSEVPFMVVAGNHESECHAPSCVIRPSCYNAFRNFSAFNGRYRMPSSSSGGAANMWYSFNVGPIHFVGVNTETDFEGAAEETHGDSGIKWMHAGGFAPKGAYLKWLESDLAQAAQDRARRPWIVAVGHRPHDQIPKIDALMQKYGVDLYHNGHVHVYHRPKRVCGDGGCTHYVTNGAAGGDETPAATRSNTPRSTKEASSGLLRASPTQLVYQQIASLDGAVLDEMVVQPRPSADGRVVV